MAWRNIPLGPKHSFRRRIPGLGKNSHRLSLSGSSRISRSLIGGYTGSFWWADQIPLALASAVTPMLWVLAAHISRELPWELRLQCHLWSEPPQPRWPPAANGWLIWGSSFKVVPHAGCRAPQVEVWQLNPHLCLVPCPAHSCLLHAWFP